ncbi:MAG: metal ABC transporter substrate-binding protein, partial [Pyramidobacter sp.]
RLGEADPAGAARYKANADAYVARLEELDAKYAEAVGTASSKTLLFGDRFPFRYLVDDYGLNYYAAFPGCSAETEASFKTVVFLARKLDELHLPAVMTIDGSDGRIAETIVQNTAEKSQKVMTLNSMQSVTAHDVMDGATYLSIMESNLETLKKALN